MTSRLCRWWGARAAEPSAKPDVELLKKSVTETLAAQQDASKMQEELVNHRRRLERIQHLNQELQARQLRRAH